MKLAIFASLLAGASAFTPQKVASTKVALEVTPESQAAFGSEIGVQAPLGFFDPCGLYVPPLRVL